MSVFVQLSFQEERDQASRRRSISLSARYCFAGVYAFLVLFDAAQGCAFTQPTPSKQLYTTRIGGKIMHSLDRTAALLLQSSKSPDEQCFCAYDRPYLAVITEPDACDSEERMKETIQAISSATSTGKVQLVSVRVVQPQHADSKIMFEERVVKLISQLVSLSASRPFDVVVTSDWVDAAVQSLAHGIHVKERHRSRIPEIRNAFSPRIPIVGTSTHSVSSALDAVSLYQPDYLFVGTCYATRSHPEKVQLEGPDLPGTVRRSIASLETDSKPVVFAIGGIDGDNCGEPVLRYGADGIAVIRAILQAPDPSRIVERMHSNMIGDFAQPSNYNSTAS